MDVPPRIVMMGTGTFARPTFEALLAHAPFQVLGLVTQPDRDAGQVRGSTRQTGPSLKEIASERGVRLIPFLPPLDIFSALLFGMLAVQSFQLLQQESRPPWRRDDW